MCVFYFKRMCSQAHCQGNVTWLGATAVYHEPRMQCSCRWRLSQSQKCWLLHFQWPRHFCANACHAAQCAEHIKSNCTPLASCRQGQDSLQDSAGQASALNSIPPPPHTHTCVRVNHNAALTHEPRLSPCITARTGMRGPVTSPQPVALLQGPQHSTAQRAVQLRTSL